MLCTTELSNQPMLQGKQRKSQHLPLSRKSSSLLLSTNKSNHPHKNKKSSALSATLSSSATDVTSPQRCLKAAQNTTMEQRLNHLMHLNRFQVYRQISIYKGHWSITENK